MASAPPSGSTRAVIAPSGDSALRIAATVDDPESGWRLVHHLARRLDEARLPGVIGTIPTYDAVLVELDPLEATGAALIPALSWIIGGLDLDEPVSAHPRVFDVPVLYDDDGSLDLAAVARQQGITPDEVVALHSGGRYVIRCLGSPGGSPMLDGPPFPHPVPRLASPRAHVPQGVVSVAGRQATITPAAAPGGWHLIGRTPLQILDLTAEPLVPYTPGDVIEFRPIDRVEYDALRGTRMAAR